MVSVVDLTIRFPDVGEEVIRFDGGIAGDVMFEGADVLVTNGVEDKVTESGGGGLVHHIFVLLERKLAG